MRTSKRQRRTARRPSHGFAKVGGTARTRGTRAKAGTVAVRVVGHLIDLGVTAGIRRDILIDAAGVIDTNLRDPDARVPMAAEIALWQTLASHISDPEFGVRAGGAHSLRATGLV